PSAVWAKKASRRSTCSTRSRPWTRRSSSALRGVPAPCRGQEVAHHPARRARQVHTYAPDLLAPHHRRRHVRVEPHHAVHVHRLDEDVEVLLIRDGGEDPPSNSK